MNSHRLKQCRTYIIHSLELARHERPSTYKPAEIQVDKLNTKLQKKDTRRFKTWIHRIVTSSNSLRHECTAFRWWIEQLIVRKSARNEISENSLFFMVPKHFISGFIWEDDNCHSRTFRCRNRFISRYISVDFVLPNI